MWNITLLKIFLLFAKIVYFPFKLGKLGLPIAKIPKNRVRE